MSKLKPNKLRKKQSPQDIEQQKHINMIRMIFSHMGFAIVPGIERKNFTFQGIRSEFDDIFYLENVIIIMEYTVSSETGTHLKGKLPIYGEISEKHSDFLKFMESNEEFKSLKSILNDTILRKYSRKEIQLRILYASKETISPEHKKLAPSNVHFFDYSIVKYFSIISKVARKSTRYEFLDFANIQYNQFGDNIKKSATETRDDFVGHILPEDRSYFTYKIVTFYIDAQSLLKRAYVLRNDSWRNVENIELYQRLLIPKKIKQMRQYLAQQKRVFINNIIVTISADDITLYDKDKNILPMEDDGEIAQLDSKGIPVQISISNKANIIGIIDGQHRIFAYHEGDDAHEDSIAKLRIDQNLLVTGIILPKNTQKDENLMFQAQLFLEINATQQGASSKLKQTIDSILSPASATSISKYLINKLNESGPLRDKFEITISDEHKIKTSSIVSFALNLLVRPYSKESLWAKWDDQDKDKILVNDKPDMKKLLEYKTFCERVLTDFFSSISKAIIQKKWQISTRKNDGILNVTVINGFINFLRDIVAENQHDKIKTYTDQFAKLNKFEFDKYKSSQYRKMGKDLYTHCFSPSSADSKGGTPNS